MTLFDYSITIGLVFLMMTPPPDSPKPVVKARADAIAREAVANLSDSHDFRIMEDKTVEREFGWVYFYAPQRYLETKDPNEMVPGAVPLVVLRENGAIDYLPSSVPPGRAIDIYEQRWREAKSGGAAEPR